MLCIYERIILSKDDLINFVSLFNDNGINYIVNNGNKAKSTHSFFF